MAKMAFWFWCVVGVLNVAIWATLIYFNLYIGWIGICLAVGLIWLAVDDLERKEKNER